MKQTICDKCGVGMKGYERFRSIYVYNARTGANEDLDNTFDLCTHCYTEFERWLAGDTGDVKCQES